MPFKDYNRNNAQMSLCFFLGFPSLLTVDHVQCHTAHMISNFKRKHEHSRSSVKDNDRRAPASKMTYLPIFARPFESYY